MGATQDKQPLLSDAEMQMPMEALLLDQIVAPLLKMWPASLTGSVISRVELPRAMSTPFATRSRACRLRSISKTRRLRN